MTDPTSEIVLMEIPIETHQAAQNDRLALVGVDGHEQCRTFNCSVDHDRDR